MATFDPVNQDTLFDHQHRKVIALWLFVLCAMVFIMVVLGGVTRLTNSGLSMVEWRPVSGWLPPMDQSAWEDIFTKYRRHPEFVEINPDMDLAGFKSIFWLEFIHRLWGRAMGVVFVLPFLYFVFRGWVDRRLAPRLVIIFILGGLQGVLGWYMVKSGLVDRPDVSQYRLTAHLGAAVVIYGYMLWLALGLLRQGGQTRRHPLAALAVGIAGLVFLTILSGGFVAGLDAGFAYNTFPLMDGELIPGDLFDSDPAYLSFFEDITTVQFNHRVLALAVFGVVAVFWLKARDLALEPRRRLAVHALAAAVAMQVVLGISTLLLFIPVPLAVAHQAGALVVFTAALWTAWELGGGGKSPA